MEISIKEAANRFGVGRSTLYKKFSSGELSRLPNGKIELSELLRVYGDVSKRPRETPQDTQNETLLKAKEETIQRLETALRETREQLQKAEERETWQRGQIDKLTDTVKLLEAPKHHEPKKKRAWWRFWRQA